MNREKIEDMLKRMVSEADYRHSLGTMEMCRRLAAMYGYENETAETAGLIHDCAKGFGSKKTVLLCKKFNIPLDEFFYSNPLLAHGLLGTEVARRLFLSGDDGPNGDIITAIADHGTGKPNMPLLSKILFVADFGEDGRQGEDAELIRSAAMKSLDEALLYAYNHYIKSLIRANSVVHPLTAAGRNYLLLTAVGDVKA